MKTFGIIAIMLILVGLVVSWERLRYKECIKVGHSKTYCILNINPK